MKKRSKRYKEISKSISKDKNLNLKEIIEQVKKILTLNLMSRLMYL